MFAGKSSLRAKEVVPVKLDPAMQAYLKRYENSRGSGASGAGGDIAKKKRKKKKGVATALAGVRIVDESVSGFLSGPAAAADEPEDEDEDGYGAPRLWQVPQRRRPWHARDPPAVAVYHRPCHARDPSAAGQSRLTSPSTGMQASAYHIQRRLARLRYQVCDNGEDGMHL